MSDIKLVSKEYAESVFVTGPQLSDAIALKQNKLKAGENITISADNTISATGGDSSEQPIYDIYKYNQDTTAPNNLKCSINVNTKFPTKGTLILTHIVIPWFYVSEKNNVYIGYSKKSTYKEQHKRDDFFCVSVNPYLNDTEEDLKQIYNVECYLNYDLIKDFPCGPDGVWTGWIDFHTPNNNIRLAQYAMKIDENGDEIYTYVSDMPPYPGGKLMPPSYAPIFPQTTPTEFTTADIWSTNPAFDPANPDSENMTAKIRPNSFPTMNLCCGLKFVFKPDLNWPKDHPVFTPPAE